jgi:hypothetical protein
MQPVMDSRDIFRWILENEFSSSFTTIKLHFLLSKAYFFRNSYFCKALLRILEKGSFCYDEKLITMATGIIDQLFLPPGKEALGHH